MLWWNPQKRRMVVGLRRLSDRHRSGSVVERLEERLPLGSFPTATGTVAGELLPIATVDLLCPHDLQHLEAVDAGLLERLRPAQLEVDAVLEQLAQMRREGEAAVENQAREQAEDAEFERDRKPVRQVESADTTAVEVVIQKYGVEAEKGLREALEMLDFGVPEVAEKEAEESEPTKTEEPESSDQTETDDAAFSTEDDEDSAALTQAINITFAATGSPLDPPRATPGSDSPFGGGGGQMSAGISDIAFSQYAPDSEIDVSQFVPSLANLMSRTGTAWFQQFEQPVVVQYDFRDVGSFANQLTSDEQLAAQAAMAAWTEATNGKVQFVRDTTAPEESIVNIGKGDLQAFGFESQLGGTLALGGGLATIETDGSPSVTGIAWLDESESWDSQLGNSGAAGTYDVFTVVAHELGHSLGGLDESLDFNGDMLSGAYQSERDVPAIQFAIQHHDFVAQPASAAEFSSYELHAMMTGFPQLVGAEVQTLLGLASSLTPSRDAIIAIVDRGGNILGVRVEDGVAPAITGNVQLLTYAIDGAVAKARTAAFFASDSAPLTSRTIRNISQSTLTLREVNSNPNVTNPLLRGPGFVGPIGVGGHFPPAVMNTPPVDLFAIEHTNRDSLIHPGVDGDRRAAADNIALPSRFNVALANVPLDTNSDGVRDVPDANNDGIADKGAINAPESYGTQSGRFVRAQSRGIATLPGGVPLFRDAKLGDGIGDTLIGGVGVFFPGPDGSAEFEQGFVAGVGQTELQRTNAPKVLEAEFIAVVTAGGSIQAVQSGALGAKPAGLPIPSLDIPFGRIDLVGITLDVIGPRTGIVGVTDLLIFGGNLRANATPGTLVANGTDQIVKPGITYADGQSVPEGWLVRAHDGGDYNGDGLPDITAADVMQIVTQGVTEANRVRAAIRLPISSRTRMVLAVADRSGEVLGLFRMPDATFFSIDVAVAKARNTAYYADVTAIRNVDRVEQTFGVMATQVPKGTAFTNRTFRFLAEPRFPSGVEGSRPGEFSILHDIAKATGISPVSGANIVRLVESSAPISANVFNNATASVAGHDAFFAATNFRDPSNVANQNGIVFFPGSSSVYKTGQLMGGFGVSGDGVDQDDVVTFRGSTGFTPPATVLRADNILVDGVRLPYIKFLRNPYG